MFVVIDRAPRNVISPSFFLLANIGVKRGPSPIINRLPFLICFLFMALSLLQYLFPLSLSLSPVAHWARARSSKVLWLMEFYGWHLGRLLHFTFILVSLQAAQKTVCMEKS